MFIKPAHTAVVLSILLQSLKSSKLHHHHPPPHPRHNHHSHHLPHVTIGPYQPWKWDKESLTNLEEHPVAGSSSGPSGYQTNIIIDPFSQVNCRTRNLIMLNIILYHDCMLVLIIIC